MACREETEAYPGEGEAYPEEGEAYPGEGEPPEEVDTCEEWKAYGDVEACVDVV